VCLLLGICADLSTPLAIVFEFISGGSLDKLTRNLNFEFTKDIIFQMALEIASGMEHLHCENILHIDLSVIKKRLIKYVIMITD